MEESELHERLRIAEEEILYARHYDRVVVNRDLDECTAECLKAINEWRNS